ncbi:MAG: choice-of-anchor D domain-containing protein [Deltaproteobacteria bacterium]|jgi:hypothetical protein
MRSRRLVTWALGLVALGGGCDCGGGGDDAPASVPFDVAPDIVAFGRVAVGRAARASLRVENLGLGALAIERVEIAESLRNELEVRGTPAGLGRQGLADVELVFTPAQVGTRRDTVTFVVDGERFEVLVTAVVADPNLVASPDTIDFGRIVVGTIATATVTLSNRGLGRVTIFSLALQMGTSSEFVVALDNLTSLDSGESVDFLVTYAPSDSLADEGRVVVASDSTGTDPVGVALYGEAITVELEVLPGNGLEFVGVFVGETRTQELELRNVGSTPHDVTALTVDDPRGRFALGESAPAVPFSLDAGAIVRVPVTFTPEVAGPFAASVTVESTGLLEPTSIPLSGNGVSLSSADVAFARRLDFGTISRAHPTPRRFTIANTGISTIDVRAMAIDPPDAPFTIEDWPGDLPLVRGDTHTLTITAAPLADGPVTAALVFDALESQRVVLTATATEPVPDLLVERSSLEFGWVPRDEVSVQRVDLRSVGPVPVRVDAVTSNDPRWVVEPGALPRVLQPGERVPIHVTFSAPENLDSTLTATLAITSTDPDLGVQRVPMSATTIPPADTYGVDVAVTWSPTDADLDLHLVQQSGGPFDRPGDVCFCNPAPAVSPLGPTLRDPRLVLESADGAVGERALVREGAQLYTLYVHAARAVAPVTATVELRSLGVRRDVLERVLSEDDWWPVGELVWLGGGTYALEPLKLPVTSVDRDRCF